MSITQLGRHMVRVVGVFGDKRVVTECGLRILNEVMQLVALECKKSGGCPHCGWGAA